MSYMTPSFSSSSITTTSASSDCMVAHRRLSRSMYASFPHVLLFKNSLYSSPVLTESKKVSVFQFTTRRVVEPAILPATDTPSVPQSFEAVSGEQAAQPEKIKAQIQPGTSTCPYIDSFIIDSSTILQDIKNSLL